METKFKEVDFHKYCETCEHKGLKEHEDPCDECLQNTVNEYSHKPVNWKEKE